MEINVRPKKDPAWQDPPIRLDGYWPPGSVVSKHFAPNTYLETTRYYASYVGKEVDGGWILGVYSLAFSVFLLFWQMRSFDNWRGFSWDR